MRITKGNYGPIMLITSYLLLLKWVGHVPINCGPSVHHNNYHGAKYYATPVPLVALPHLLLPLPDWLELGIALHSSGLTDRRYRGVTDEVIGFLLGGKPGYDWIQRLGLVVDLILEHLAVVVALDNGQLESGITIDDGQHEFISFHMR